MQDTTQSPGESSIASFQLEQNGQVSKVPTGSMNCKQWLKQCVHLCNQNGDIP